MFFYSPVCDRSSSVSFKAGNLDAALDGKIESSR